MSSGYKINKYGTKRWYNSKREFHREDGPAVEYANGYKVWYLNGKKYSQEEWLTKMRKIKLAKL